MEIKGVVTDISNSVASVWTTETADDIFVPPSMSFGLQLGNWILFETEKDTRFGQPCLRVTKLELIDDCLQSKVVDDQLQIRVTISFNEHCQAQSEWLIGRSPNLGRVLLHRPSLCPPSNTFLGWVVKIKPRFYIHWQVVVVEEVTRRRRIDRLMIGANRQNQASNAKQNIAMCDTFDPSTSTNSENIRDAIGVIIYMSEKYAFVFSRIINRCRIMSSLITEKKLPICIGRWIRFDAVFFQPYNNYEKDLRVVDYSIIEEQAPTFIINNKLIKIRTVVKWIVENAHFESPLIGQILDDRNLLPPLAKSAPFVISAIKIPFANDCSWAVFEVICRDTSTSCSNTNIDICSESTSSDRPSSSSDCLREIMTESTISDLPTSPENFYFANQTEIPGQDSHSKLKSRTRKPADCGAIRLVQRMFENEKLRLFINDRNPNLMDEFYIYILNNSC